MSRRLLAWLSLGALALHNAEEALALHTYQPQLATRLPEPLTSTATALSYSAMLVALAVVLVLAWLVVLATVTWPQSPRALWAFLTLQAVLAVNVVAHVLSAVVVFRGYSPGLATALLVNAPLALYCLRRARRERWISAAALRTTVPAALVLHGPVLMGGLWLAGWASR